MLTRFHPKSHGFSLIELMVVIAIVGTLTAMAVPTIKNLVGRAKEAEATSNLRSLMGLAQTYFHDENDRVSTYGSGNLVAPASRNVFTTSTSCVQDTNLFGFRMTDCQKVNYVYGVLTSAAARTFGAWALEGGTTGAKRIYPQCGGSSLWGASNGNVYNGHSPSNLVDCQVCLNIKMTSKIGSNDLAFDLNGNGVVAAEDFSQILMMVAMGGAGATMPHLSSCP